MSIAGSDSSGGAGIQADLKTFAAHGVYGMTALTAVTAQNTLGVEAVEALSGSMVAAQIDAVVADPGVDAVKVGMLANVDIVRAVEASLRRAREGRAFPVVLDPVMISKSGAALLDDDAVSHLQELFAQATLLTPNLPEAFRIDGTSSSRADTDLAGRERLVRRLGERTAAVLLKGGHAEGGEVVDLLWDGDQLHRFVHERVESRSTHGTGCTLSSAIAARLGRGEALVEAVGGAIEWLHEAIARAVPIGAGAGPVDHLWRLRPEAGKGAGGFA